MRARSAASRTSCPTSTSCAGWPRRTSTAGWTAARATCWSARHSGRISSKKAHMICELSPYSCMPNTMSIGAMAGVIGKYPGPALRAARDQGRRRGARALALPDDPDRGEEARAARVRGQRSQRTGLTSSRCAATCDAHPEMKRATYRDARTHGVVGHAPPTLVLHVAQRMGRPSRDEDRRRRRRLHHRQGRRSWRTAA